MPCPICQVSHSVSAVLANGYLSSANSTSCSIISEGIGVSEEE